MKNPLAKQAFLIVSTVIDKATISQYKKIKQATQSLGDVFLLYHQTGNLPELPADINIEVFTDQVLTDLNIKPIYDSIVPGSNHFPVFDFFRKHPHYDYYWNIENDVAFNGNWGDFFSEISNLPSDFITSHIRKYSGEPHWHWWDTYKNPYPDTIKDSLYRCFNPIYRISFTALNYLYTQQVKGFVGHHEVLFPSLLKKQGFNISDFGDEMVDNRPALSFCTLKTMRWKPVFLFPGIKKNKLYHPVKANISFRQLAVFLKRSILNETSYVT